MVIYCSYTDNANNVSPDLSIAQNGNKLVGSASVEQTVKTFNKTTGWQRSNVLFGSVLVLSEMWASIIYKDWPSLFKVEIRQQREGDNLGQGVDHKSVAQSRDA